MDNSYDVDVNGLFLNGKLVPETILENILSFVCVKDILKLRQVCQLWRDIVTRRTFWKDVFEKNGHQWELVPEHIKENKETWAALYRLINHDHENLVKNHSGHNAFRNWEKFHNHDSFIIESPPVGIVGLPIDPMDVYPVNRAFVTSFTWGGLQQKIYFNKIGLTPKLIRLMEPFDFVCRLMIGARFDCGGKYSVGLQIFNKNGEVSASNETSGEIQSGSNWTEVCCSLNVASTSNANYKYLLVSIRGKDNQFWAGHYGTKFSRISVSLKCLDRTC